MAALRAHGWVCWPNQRERAGRTRASHIGFKGISDVLGFARRVARVRPGTFLAVEFKRPGAALTAEQRAFLALVSQCNGVAVLATSVDDLSAAMGWAR